MPVIVLTLMSYIEEILGPECTIDVTTQIISS